MSDKAVRGQVLSLLIDHPDVTYGKIGSIAGCSKQRVHQIAKEAGLTRRRPPYYRSDVTVDKVLELYHRNLLIKEIAPILGCSRYTVTSRLREAGISAGECFSRIQRLLRQWYFSRRDDITVARVLNLYHNGLLIKEIAKTLDCNPVTVKSRLSEAGISKSECISRGLVIRWRRGKKPER